MMKQVIIILLLILSYSCKKENSLDIKELNFSDIDQQGIIKNKIKKSYLIPMFDGGNFEKHDTLSFKEYDKNGNIIYNYWKGSLYSTRIRYTYDSLNLLTQKNYATDYEIVYNYNYTFNPDSLILYKNYKNNLKNTISGTYKFNKNGLLIESSYYKDDDISSGEKYTTKYKYDSLNLLISKKNTINPIRKKDCTNLYNLYNETIRFYYTNKKIDSTVNLLRPVNEEFASYKRKTMYDENGLKSKTIEIHNDFGTLLFLHKHQK